MSEGIRKELNFFAHTALTKRDTGAPRKYDTAWQRTHNGKARTTTNRMVFAPDVKSKSTNHEPGKHSRMLTYGFQKNTQYMRTEEYLRAPVRQTYICTDGSYKQAPGAFIVK